jgi:DNA-binding NarL/FixJ family response regulator
MRQRSRIPRRSRPTATLEPPRDIRSSRICIDGDEHLVLSYPLPKVVAPSELSPAEREVAEALVHGWSLEDIAQRRGTSARTVANQARSIFEKLRVDSRIALARIMTRR